MFGSKNNMEAVKHMNEGIHYIKRHRYNELHSP